MRRAVLYHVLAGVLAVIVGIAYTVATLIIRKHHGWPSPPSPIYRLLLMSAAGRVCLIGMTLARGRRLGGGDPALGLATVPIPRSRLFAWAVVGQCALLILGVQELPAWPAFRIALNNARALLLPLAAMRYT